HTLQFVHPAGYSIFSTLRRKLHWNLMPQLTDEIE
ncbi:MAG TPA: NAD(+) kinase, partial [Pusillimonas sp.]|nr:NAD(+) kinase [Pusillimonas sp.]